MKQTQSFTSSEHSETIGIRKKFQVPSSFWQGALPRVWNTESRSLHWSVEGRAPEPDGRSVYPLCSSFTEIS